MHELPSIDQKKPAVYASDEIDLFELLGDLWARKWWVVGSCVVTLLIALGYLLLTPSVFQVQSNIEMVAPQKLASVSVPGVDYQLTPEEAEAKVQQRLASWDTRKAYFMANPSLFSSLKQKGVSPAQTFEAFDSKNFVLHLAQTDGKNLSLKDRATYIQLTYPESINGVAITNGLMNYALAQAKKNVIAAFKGSLHQQLSGLHHQVASLRDNYVGQLRYHQSQLSNALTIAQRLGIKQTAIPKGFGGVYVNNTFQLPAPATPALLNDQDQNKRREHADKPISNEAVPLYFLGVRALSAQLASVDKHLASYHKAGQQFETESASFKDLSLDNQINGLYKLKQKGKYLASLAPDFSSLQLADITRQASAPSQALKPRKLLVVAIALLLGLMLGCVLALFSAALHKRRLLN